MPAELIDGIVHLLVNPEAVHMSEKSPFRWSASARIVAQSPWGMWVVNAVLEHELWNSPTAMVNRHRDPSHFRGHGVNRGHFRLFAAKG